MRKLLPIAAPGAPPEARPADAAERGLHELHAAPVALSPPAFPLRG